MTDTLLLVYVDLSEFFEMLCAKTKKHGKPGERLSVFFCVFGRIAMLIYRRASASRDGIRI